MNPTIHNNTTDPPGVLPKRTGLILLAVIAGIIAVASIFSGKTERKQSPQAGAAATGPNAAQLAQFMKALEKERLGVDEERRHREDQRRLEEQSIPGPPPPDRSGYAASVPYRPAPVVDPLEQKRKERDDQAPFSSNIALRVPLSDTDRPKRGEEANETSASLKESGNPSQNPDSRRAPAKITLSAKGDSESSAPTGSGTFHPPREGLLFRIYEGTMIPTALVNRLDGTFTGPVKCVVSEDVRSKDGKAVLIPAGAQFFGEARRVDALDQRRLAISFKRLLLPNGYSIDDLANDPGLSKAGETGLKDKSDSHYLRALGLSGVVGLLGGVALYGGQGGAAAYATGVANSTGSSATSILNRFVNVMPTITIREGHPVMVYLSTDLLVPEYRPEKD